MKQALSLFLIVFAILFTACSDKNKKEQQADDPFAPGASGRPSMPPPPPSQQLAAGEALYSGTAGLGTSGSIVISFVLSADKKEIRDMKVNIDGLKYTIDRGNSSTTVNIGSIQKTYYTKHPITKGATDIIFEKSKIAGLTFTANGATGTLTYVHVHKDNNLSSSNPDVDVPLGTAKIDFKIIDQK